MTEQHYQEALLWLFAQVPNYQTDGAAAYKPGLQNIQKLCDYFGNPQKELKMVHIGGTNGKGSTCNMLASVLQEAHYKTGLYTSPHLIDFRERIRVDGEICDQEFVFEFIQKLKKIPSDISPSFFEFTTVMAFDYFRKKKVDVAIIEVGLGGRLDATNIISPLITAITNIALDHQNILGSTLAQIAKEKAGIIKPGIPVACGESTPAIANIISQKALQQNAEFIDATGFQSDYQSDLKGNYQRKNIKVVLAIVSELRKSGFEISEENLKNGLLNVQKNTRFLGRWYRFSEKPLIICDTAHNQAGLEEVFGQLSAMPQFKHIILGFVADKKIDEVLKILPQHARFYFTKPAIKRGRDPHDYEEQLQALPISYSIFGNVQAAYLSALKMLRANEMIFIGGSNFVVGEFLENNLHN